MGQVTIDDFIFLMNNRRVVLNEKSNLTPKQFFKCSSKNKCNYKILKRVPALDYDASQIVVENSKSHIIIKKEKLPNRENIENTLYCYPEEDEFCISVDIPPIGSCIKYFFGEKVEYDGSYNADGNILGHDYLFMLSLPVNLKEVPKSIVNRFTVCKMYTKNIFYNGTQYFYTDIHGKPRSFIKYNQMLHISNNLTRETDIDYEKIIKDIRFSKMVCVDHSDKLLISREKDGHIDVIKPYVGTVFSILKEMY